MAIFSKYLVASSVFSIAALAAPLIQRDLVTEIDIVTETVWTTLDVTTTIYDNAGTAAPEVPATSAPAMTITTSAMQMTTVPTSATTPATTLVPVTTPAAAAPVSSSAPAAQFFTTSATSAAGGLAEADSTTPAPAPTTPTTSAAPVASSSPASAAAEGTAAGSVPAGSTTGTCEGSGAPCVGDVTHWDGGLGACGTVVDTDTDLAIALPFEFMGTLSNTNPYCGRSVTLYNPTSGTTVQAVVKDKCMGCVDRAIDCTNTLFNQITDNLGNGRESGIEWWLN